jgi:hypothetical protein
MINMDKKKTATSEKKQSIPSAHQQADNDIRNDEDLSKKGPEDELDEGELARFEDNDEGEMDISDKNGNT